MIKVDIKKIALYKKNSMFSKLVISYVMIIFFSIVLVGLPSYMVLTKNFNNEIEMKNNEILGYFKRAIEQEVLLKADKVYADIINNDEISNCLLKNADLSMPEKGIVVKDIYTVICSKATLNSEIIDAVHIYFSNSGVLISSSNGINYMNSGKKIAAPLESFIQNIKDSNSAILWMPLYNETGANNQETDRPTDILRFVKAYPVKSALKESWGSIMVDVKVSAINDIIRKYVSRDSNILILDDKGTVITSTSMKYFNEKADKDFYIQNIVNSQVKQNNLIHKFSSGEKSMVSFHTFDNNWKFIAQTSLDKFYMISNLIKLTFIFLGVFTFLIGVVLARIMALRMYNPIKSLMDNIFRQFGSAIKNKDPGEGEIVIINDVINNISAKLSNMESLLTANIPIIVFNIVNGLLHGTIANEQELRERMALIDLPLNATFFRTIILKLDDKIIKGLSIENRQYMKYSIIQELQSKSFLNDLYLSAELSDSEIGVVVFATSNDDKRIKRFIGSIIEYVLSNFQFTPFVYVGGWVYNPIEVKDSYNEALIASKYQYFFPHTDVFYSDQYKDAELNQEQMPDYLIEDFKKALKSGSIDEIEKCLAEFQKMIMTKKYSAKECHLQINRFISVLSLYLRELNINTAMLSELHQLDEFENITNIIQWRDWIYNIISAVNDYVKSKKNAISHDAIEKIKQYIDNNIAMDLSVEMLAEQVFLSPSYISRIFKSVIGKTIVEYITERRLEIARDYILNKDGYTVEQIGKMVGFNSPAYFVKKFREAYSTSPKNYKQIYIESQRNKNSYLNK